MIWPLKTSLFLKLLKTEKLAEIIYDPYIFFFNFSLQPFRRYTHFTKRGFFLYHAAGIRVNIAFMFLAWFSAWTRSVGKAKNLYQVVDKMLDEEVNAERKTAESRVQV